MNIGARGWRQARARAACWAGVGRLKTWAGVAAAGLASDGRARPTTHIATGSGVGVPHIAMI
jgi:hypothetical protein